MPLERLPRNNRYIDRDPETIKKQEALAKKEKLDLDDQDRLARFIDKQIERDRQRTAEPPSTADANLAEFRREDEEEKGEVPLSCLCRAGL